MESKWVPDSAVVARFASLVRAGSSIRAAAGVVCLPESVAYRLAGELDLPRKRCRRISSADSQEIARLWLEGVAPMDIARQLSIGSSPVYRSVLSLVCGSAIHMAAKLRPQLAGVVICNCVRML